MKKTIICLGLALATLATPVMATTSVAVSTKNLFSTYGKLTPLCVAIQKGEIDFVKTLFVFGFDIGTVGE